MSAEQIETFWRASGRRNWRPAGIYLICSLALAGVLDAMGRIPWCSTGFGFWTWQATGRCTSQLLGDPYSFTHWLHGVIFYGLTWLVLRRRSTNVRFLIATLVETGWEILENTPFVIDRYRQQTAALDYYGDSILNSLGDLAFCSLGFAMAAKMPVKVTVAAMIAIELGLLLAYRDNLLLNVIMLMWPIQALRDWQLRG